MMSNQIFHWPRFVECFLYFLRRDGQVLWIPPLIVFGLAQFSLSTAPGGVLVLLVMVSSFVYTSRTCRELGGPPASGLRLILLPASAFEKILSLWILSALVFPGLLLLSAWLAVDVRSLVLGWGSRAPIISEAGDVTTWLESLSELMIKGVRFWAVHAIFLWGSVFFRKKAFIKTGFMVLLSYLTFKLAVLLSFLLLCLIADGMRQFGGTSVYWSYIGDKWTWIRGIIYFLPCALAPLFWQLAYRRFRITEV